MKNLISITLFVGVLVGCGGGGGGSDSQGSTPPSNTSSSSVSSSSSSVAVKTNLITGCVTHDYIPSLKAPAFSKTGESVGEKVNGWDVSARTQRPSPNIHVQIVGDGQVATQGFTDNAGCYSMAVPVTFKSLSVKAFAETKFISVNPRSSENIYVVSSEEFPNVDSIKNLKINFRETHLGDSVNDYAALPFIVLENARSALSEWGKTIDMSGFKPVAIKFDPLVYDNTTYFNPNNFSIVLSGISKSGQFVDHFMNPGAIVHEMGHYFMYSGSAGLSSLGGGHISSDNLLGVQNETVAEALASVTFGRLVTSYVYLDGDKDLWTFSPGNFDANSADGEFSDEFMAYLIAKSTNGKLPILLKALTSNDYAKASIQTIYTFLGALKQVDGKAGSDLESSLRAIGIMGAVPNGDGETFFNGNPLLKQYIFPITQRVGGAPVQVCTSKNSKATVNDAANNKFIFIDIPKGASRIQISATQISSEFSKPSCSLMAVYGGNGGPIHGSTQPQGCSLLDVTATDGMAVILTGVTDEADLSSVGNQKTCFNVSVSVKL